MRNTSHSVVKHTRNFVNNHRRAIEITRNVVAIASIALIAIPLVAPVAIPAMAIAALGIVEVGLDLAVGDNTSAAVGLLCLFPMGKGIKYIGEIGGDAIKSGSEAKILYKIAIKEAKIIKNVSNGITKAEWDMLAGGGIINGRKYSQHAMERMAPNIPEVRAELYKRARKLAKGKGLIPQTKEYSTFIDKYVDPRNIPPMVIEDAIKNTKPIPGNRPDTFLYEAQSVKVIVNGNGDVITVIPK
ncbi:hypothetical protein HZR17_00605 [Clostridium botulinum]|uniref:hypothetical protein n=1 Tax=Clostridium botulinum TaxID=1491 RepID=UPI00098384BA|nr:hypothetical protein [Clostridium botulinum]MBZ1328255.1 hypothetical protein [Clostridium botulinum]MBZ1331643.1 hypothetical protein [Clostridium botulinum]MBZ1334782.1 hypothetical protein [Clostridium botulinum]MBZ1338276.1 hypothetical protein [Clostridium botulinum]MCW6081013.1 hypothetical protein [Clostridium botulinum]